MESVEVKIIILGIMAYSVFNMSKSTIWSFIILMMIGSLCSSCTQENVPVPSLSFVDLVNADTDCIELLCSVAGNITVDRLYVEYSKDSNLSNSKTVQMVLSESTYSVTISELEVQTTYYYRYTVENSLSRITDQTIRHFTTHGIAASGIVLNESKISLMVGDTKDLNYTVFPQNASTKVRWEGSSNNNVVSIENGKIIAKNSGRCMIRAVTEAGVASPFYFVEVRDKPVASIWDGKSVSFEWYTRSSDKKVFHIESANELAGLSQALSPQDYKYGNFMGCTFSLETDIDLAGYDWTPIGNIVNGGHYGFAGVFDGKGHSINNMRITRTADSSLGCAGLFGCACWGTVRDLTVKGKINVEGCGEPDMTWYLYVGGIIGESTHASCVENCCSDIEISINAVQGNSNGSHVSVGGVVGSSHDGMINGCSASGKIDISNNYIRDFSIGGIVGGLGNASITRCSSSSFISVTGAETEPIVGGIVGVEQKAEVCNVISCGRFIMGATKRTILGGIIGQIVQSPSDGELDKVSIANSLMTGTYGICNANDMISAVLGQVVGSLDMIQISNSYYLNYLYSQASIGTPISFSDLNQGNLLGLDSSVWKIERGIMPYLIF